MSTAYDGQTALLAISFPGVNLYPSKVMGVNWVHIFSPSIVNSARIGFTRTVWNRACRKIPLDSLGPPVTAKVGITFPNQAFNGFTYQDLGAGLSGVGTPAFDGGIIDNTYSYIDNLTWVLGRHTVSHWRPGAALPEQLPDEQQQRLSRSSEIQRQPSRAIPPWAVRQASAARTSCSTGSARQPPRSAASTLDSGSGAPPGSSVTTSKPRHASRSTSECVTSRTSPGSKKTTRQATSISATGQVIYAGQVPAGAPAGSGVCSNRALLSSNYRQIMPRLGFAYQATDRFVVRGGYGATSFL